VVEDADSVLRQAVAAGATESSPVSNEHGFAGADTAGRRMELE
jgi:hypothetical protein